MENESNIKEYHCSICGTLSTARDGHYDCSPGIFPSLKEIQSFINRENQMAKSPMTYWAFIESKKHACWEVHISCSGKKLKFYSSDLGWDRKVKMFFAEQGLRQSYPQGSF